MSQSRILPVAYNSIQSQKLGRRIYQIQQGQQWFWLKLQLKNSNRCYQQHFFNELNCYSELNALETETQPVLLNFSIFDPFQQFKIDEEVIDQALWVEDAPKLFQDLPDRLSLAEIGKRLLLSLDVLEHLHDYGYLHGDIKVEHFRVKDEKSYLIDFEQAVNIAQEANLTNIATHTATPRYMAPELFHGQPKSFQSDIYALGIVWLEWLTQQRLSAKSYQDWAFLHCQQLNVVLPQQFKIFEMVLTEMLMKKIGQRCSNIYQIKQVLSQIV